MKKVFFCSGGYKGYGLAMLVEVLCGILSGATYGKHIRRWMSTSQVANLVSKNHKLERNTV